MEDFMEDFMEEAPLETGWGKKGQDNLEGRNSICKDMAM